MRLGSRPPPFVVGDEDAGRLCVYREALGFDLFGAAFERAAAAASHVAVCEEDRGRDEPVKTCPRGT